MTSEKIHIGTITSTHGLKGQVKIFSHINQFEDLALNGKIANVSNHIIKFINRKKKFLDFLKILILRKNKMIKCNNLYLLSIAEYNMLPPATRVISILGISHETVPGLNLIEVNNHTMFGLTDELTVQNEQVNKLFIFWLLSNE